MVICGKKVTLAEARYELQRSYEFLFITGAWSSCVLDNWFFGQEPNKSSDISFFKMAVK